ncbi:ABC transporter permease DevC [Cerasicoccus arenae]|uniref:ABC transporter n=1 Tax=Cerasicoccus arenae TaxID=424488 RepID=A0A8J3DJB8_9BACT|nr:ABC transporter permease DevC [Cerasicoccus arenae]MBK1858552.1 FtsX-like permease family protein [Cerasicoccus arenae]GHC06248.1 ABC transporter [Cerasicoccus arenae]
MSLINKLVPLGIPLAWLNLVKEKKRFFAAVAGIIFAVTMMLYQMGLKTAMFTQVVFPHLMLNGDIVIVNPQYEYFGISRGFTEKRLNQAFALPEVEDVAPLYLVNLPIKNPDTLVNRDIFIIGFDPANKPFDDPAIEAQQGMLKIPGNALFDERSHAKFGPIVERLEDGTVTTETNGRATEIVGSFEMGTTFAADGNLLVGKQTFFEIFPGQDPNLAAVGLIMLKEGSDAEKVAETLRAKLPHDVKIMTRAEFIDNEKRYWGERTPIGFVISASMTVAIIVGAVIVYQILYTDVTDHLEEYATLKSIGFKDSYFISLILQESIILSVFGFIPGAALTAGLYYVTRRVAYMPTEFQWDNAGIVLGLTIVMCMLAGALATRKLRHANPADIF